VDLGAGGAGKEKEKQENGQAEREKHNVKSHSETLIQAVAGPVRKGNTPGRLPVSQYYFIPYASEKKGVSARFPLPYSRWGWPRRKGSIPAEENIAERKG
jgi:hypothetical protein